MDDVTQTFKNMRDQQRINIAKSFGYSVESNDNIQKGDTELTPEKEEIIKALSSDNPFDVAYGKSLLEKSDMTEIEKSDIMNAISYGGNFKVKKSGKEIKEQITNVILPTKQAELATEKAKADKLLSECGAAPTNDVCSWWTNDIKMDVGYKVYSWEECCLRCCDGVSDSLSWEHQQDKPKCNAPQTEDESTARRNYNDSVQKICHILVDIKACEILTKNLNDKDSIELTPQQVLVFKFD